MRLHEQVKGGHRKAKMRSKIGPSPVGLLLEVPDASQHGKDRLNDHAVAPSFGRTVLQIRRIARWGMKALVAQPDHLLLVAANHRVKDRIVDIEFMGDFVGGTIIFGEESAEPLLGMTALESVGIEVDPLNQRLKRRPAVRLKKCAGRE